MSKYGGQNLFAALDSDEDDVAPPAAPKPTEVKAAPKVAKKQPVRNNKPRNDRNDRRGRGRDGDRQRPARGGESWGNNNAYEGRNGDRRQRTARPGARDREVAKKKTRNPRNGYGKNKAGPKKGGAGAHNWGTAVDTNAAAQADAETVAATSADAAEKPKVEVVEKEEKPEEPKPEPEPETFTLAQFEAMRLEKLKNNTAFAPRVARKVEADVGGEVIKRESHVQVRQKKSGHAGHNANAKKMGDVSKFFCAAPRPREDFGGRGRGRGRGGRGRGGGRGYSRFGNDRGSRQPRGQRAAQINIQDAAEFPSL